MKISNIIQPGWMIFDIFKDIFIFLRIFSVLNVNFHFSTYDSVFKTKEKNIFTQK